MDGLFFRSSKFLLSAYSTCVLGVRNANCSRIYMSAFFWRALQLLRFIFGGNDDEDLVANRVFGSHLSLFGPFVEGDFLCQAFLPPSFSMANGGFGTSPGAFRLSQATGAY